MKRTNHGWKKAAACLLAAVMLVTATPQTELQAKSKGYVFVYKKATVSMDGKAKALIKKAGKPKAKKVKKSCAYKGKDRTYKYRDFILYTYTKSDKGAEYANGITFLTDKVSTKEGIHIGSPYSDVAKKYGKGSEKYGVYTFKKGSCKLQIEVTNEVVTNIRYITANKPKEK